MAAGRRPLLRLLRLARPLRSRLLLSVLAGAAATGCGVALLATSGFLLARASEHPGILAISGAVVAVRALSIGRGVSRYLERLTSHDVAFRVLADIRVAIYRRLERLAPAGLAAFRSGDLLAALISDVDATQDLFIRGIGPPLAAMLVGAGAVTVCLLILAPAGGCWLSACWPPEPRCRRWRWPAPGGPPGQPRRSAANSARPSPTCYRAPPSCMRSALKTPPSPLSSRPTAG